VEAKEIANAVTVKVIASVTEAVKDAVVDVAAIDPELLWLKVMQVLLLNALKGGAKEKDLKASPMKMLTPWIVRMVPDVDIAVTAKVELLVSTPGLMKKNSRSR